MKIKSGVSFYYIPHKSMTNLLLSEQLPHNRESAGSEVRLFPFRWGHITHREKKPQGKPLARPIFWYSVAPKVHNKPLDSLFSIPVTSFSFAFASDYYCRDYYYICISYYSRGHLKLSPQVQGWQQILSTKLQTKPAWNNVYRCQSIETGTLVFSNATRPVFFL